MVTRWVAASETYSSAPCCPLAGTERSSICDGVPVATGDGDPPHAASDATAKQVSAKSEKARIFIRLASHGRESPPVRIFSAKRRQALSRARIVGWASNGCSLACQQIGNPSHARILRQPRSADLMAAG